MAEPTLKIAIADGPKCPHCGCDGFDDWWHDPSIKASFGTLSGRLKCHGCGKFFALTQYSDGAVHSSARSRPGAPQPHGKENPA